MRELASFHHFVLLKRGRLKNEPMEVLKEKTKSICPQCFQELDASIVEDNTSVFLKKECPIHGSFNILIEKDAKFYKRIMNKEFKKDRIPFRSLSLPIVNQCNLNCQVCYAPDRGNKYFSTEELKTAIRDFTGEQVKFTGGEPTLCEDLPLLIKAGYEYGKRSLLITNGIKLTNMSFVKMLKKVGLKIVVISFHGGFRDDIYEKINGQKLLGDKLKAFKNLKRTGMKLCLTVTLVRGVNENELTKAYRYYLKNKSFIKQFRIRSLSYIGRHVEANPFCLSEIIKLLSKVSGFSTDELIEPFFQYPPYHHSTCSFSVDLFKSFIYRINKKGIQNKIFRKISFILDGLFLFGIRKTFDMVINKIKGKKVLFDARIEIRIWPDKQRIDLGEIQWCRTALLAQDKSLVPFCHAIIMDEKDRVLQK